MLRIITGSFFSRQKLDPVLKMNELTNLRDFLESRRIGPNDEFNFLLMNTLGIFHQGRFFIRKDEQKVLWSLWGDASPYFKEGNSPALVYRPPSRHHQPLNLDVDLRFEKEVAIPPEVHAAFAKEVARKLVDVCNQTVEYYCVSKKTG